MRHFTRRPQYLPGDVMQIMPGMQPEAITGALVRIVRRSPRTGSLTVEFTAAAGPYAKGDTINVPPYAVHLPVIT